MLDLVIRNADVVDGTGAPRRRADVGVADGRVAAIGDVAERGIREIDAEGKVVAPGFVDIHTHYDAQLLWDPTASPSPLHGVTTVMSGNCGFTLAPADPDAHDYLTRMLGRVEGMPLAALEAGLDWQWESFADWLRLFDAGIGPNAGFLCGHSALRRTVMGDAATEREATPGEIVNMQRLLHESLGAGALGFSTSTSPTHNDGDGRPVPSRVAGREELIALAECVADHPAPALEAVLAGSLSGFSDEEVDLMADLSAAADRPLNWNVLAVTARSRDFVEAQLGVADRAAARGGRVLALTLPHVMRIRLSFATGFVLDGLPGWREVFALPIPERIAALRDPDTRRRLADGAASEAAGILRHLAKWERLELCETFSDATAQFEGKTVGEVAAARGVEPWDALLDIVIADDLRTGLRPPTSDDDESDWKLRAEVWRDSRTIVGGSDAGAHLDMMCGATYTTYLLGVAVRERGLLTLEEAVAALSDVPARLYGLRDRGRLAAGNCADIVIFDPVTIAPGIERTVDDLPGGASRIYADATGVEHVLVNGVPLVAAGEFTASLPGRVLRSGRDADAVHARAY